MQHVDMLTTTDCIDLKGDQAGGCWHVDHNTGLVFMRSRPIVLEFTAAWKKKIETTRDVMIRDQACHADLEHRAIAGRVPGHRSQAGLLLTHV
jgi:hypothetical protein